MKKLLILVLFTAMSVSVFAQNIKKVYTQAEAYSFNGSIGDYALLGSNFEKNTIEIKGSEISITSQNGKKRTFKCEWKNIKGTKCLVEEGNESVFVLKEDYLMWFFIFDGTVHQSLIVFK